MLTVPLPSIQISLQPASLFVRETLVSNLESPSKPPVIFRMSTLLEVLAGEAKRPLRWSGRIVVAAEKLKINASAIVTAFAI
jgi:hypothetical protein